MNKPVIEKEQAEKVLTFNKNKEFFMTLNRQSIRLLYLLRNWDKDVLKKDPLKPRLGRPYVNDIQTLFPECACEYDKLVNEGFVEIIERREIARKFIQENYSKLDNNCNHTEYYNNGDYQTNKRFQEIWDEEIRNRNSNGENLRVRLTDEGFDFMNELIAGESDL